MFYGLDLHNKLVARRIWQCRPEDAGEPDSGERLLYKLRPAGLAQGCTVTDTVLLPHAGSQVIEHRPAATELFYIAVGLVAVQLGGQVITALPGDLIEARPAARVRLWNPTAEPARVLVLRCGAP